MSTTPTDAPDLRFDWTDYQAIADQPQVYETIRALLDDHTEDNATSMVRQVVEAAAERLLKLTQAQQAQGVPEQPTLQSYPDSFLKEAGDFNHRKDVTTREQAEEFAQAYGDQCWLAGLAAAPQAEPPAPAPAPAELGPDSENYAGDEAPLPADVPYPPSLDTVTIYNAYGPMSMDPTDGQPVQAYWDREGLRDYGARCIAWAATQAPAVEAEPHPEREPLTWLQFCEIAKAEYKEAHGHDELLSAPDHEREETLRFVQMIERALAESWGIKLAGIGTKEGT